MLQVKALDLNALRGKTAAAQADAFKQSMEEVVVLMEKAKLVDARVAELLRRFLPTCAMNDRASPARAAARLVLGLKDGDNDPTCAEHALVNILEEGRKAMDAILREMMQISEEQAAGDADKIKAMRTCVGWFSSPACALIYQVAKYVALCSSKGYAIGQKFLEWIETRLADLQDQQETMDELLGNPEDMLAICGSRMYVFFLDAATTERLLSQTGSLLTFLEEEEDLQAQGGGKLRKSILTGAKSDPCMAAVRAMAIVCDAVLWPLLKAVKPAPDKHVLDVLPKVWPAALEFFRDVEARPAGLLDGTLRMDLGAAPAATATAAQARRSERARIDMARIRARATGDALVERLLKAAAAAMAKSTQNHASEWLGPDGKLCAAKVAADPTLRAKYDALVAVSTPVERLHALGRCADERGGMQRAEQRAGVVLARFNDQAGWLQQKDASGLQRALDICRAEARLARRLTIREQRVVAGRSKREARDVQLSSKRAKREARAAEEQRVAALHVAARYSELKAMSNEALADQLKVQKQRRKAANQPVTFTVTQKNRLAYVLTLQGLLTEADSAANDLAAGDSGTDAVGVVRKKRAEGSAGGGRKKKKQKVSNACGDMWDEDEEFEDFVILKTRESAGKRAGDIGRKGEMLYFIAWEGYSAEASTWEPASNVGGGAIAEYLDSLRKEAEADGAAEAELEDDDEEDAETA